MASLYQPLPGTSDEAGGFPNVEFNPEHSVEGCVYAITDTELAMLDNCMGYPKVSGKGTLFFSPSKYFLSIFHFFFYVYESALV